MCSMGRNRSSELPDVVFDPVRDLIELGKFKDPYALWPDYEELYGVGHQHVAALIEIIRDHATYEVEAESSAFWAPVHAWRALGQLRAEAAVEPLLGLLKASGGDDYADHELPVVFGMIGSGALAPVGAFVLDSKNATWVVATAIAGLREIGKLCPDCRGACVDVLRRKLQPSQLSDATANGFAVWALLDLEAIEAIDAIRAAFRRDDVDISIAGDIEDAEVALKLRDKRATPKKGLWSLDWSPSLRADQAEFDFPTLAPARVTDTPYVVQMPVHVEKIGRNEPCPCGSGMKYKKCCLHKESASAAS